MDRSLAKQHLENQLRLYRQALDEAVVERDAAERKLAAERERCTKILSEYADTHAYDPEEHDDLLDVVEKIRSGK